MKVLERSKAKEFAWQPTYFFYGSCNHPPITDNFSLI